MTSAATRTNLTERAIGPRALAALLTIGLACVSATAAGDPGKSTALEQFRKLSCEPRSLSVQSAEPLRFAATASCYQLPKSFAHDGWIQLVAVDTDAGTVRLVDLGRDHAAGRTLQNDGHGDWRWLVRKRPHTEQTRELQAWVLPAGEMQPRQVGRVELPFDVDDHMRAYPGEGCTLIGGTRVSETREAKPVHALVKSGDSGISMQPIAGLRDVRLWHPQLRAFVVQTDEKSSAVHSLLDCDGQTRPLPEADAARFAAYPGQDIAISSRGDWLVRTGSDDGAIVVLQGDRSRWFGPFEGIPLFEARWSPSGETFLVHGFFNSVVLSTTEFKRVFRWNYRDNATADFTALLSDSRLMVLSKKRGVTFHRW